MVCFKMYIDILFIKENMNNTSLFSIILLIFNCSDTVILRHTRNKKHNGYRNYHLKNRLYYDYDNTIVVRY